MHRVTLALLITLVAPVAAHAQLGIAAGTAIPSGDFADIVDPGIHVQASYNLALPLLPDFRVDGMWQRYDEIAGGSARVLGGSANVLLDLPLLVIKPYLLGGVGYYDVAFEDETSDSGTGFTVGVGLRVGLGRLGVFGEARALRISGDMGITTLPIMIGVTF